MHTIDRMFCSSKGKIRIGVRYFGGAGGTTVSTEGWGMMMSAEADRSVPSEIFKVFCDLASRLNLPGTVRIDCFEFDGEDELMDEDIKEVLAEAFVCLIEEGEIELNPRRILRC